MEQQKLLDELNYHQADKTAKMLLNLGLITTVEYDKLQELNRQKFSPILAISAKIKLSQLREK